ncbi:hypothetical protein JXA05_01150 [Candidatus Peregrinibacteria bacterium]|nr:hypothetical protein [Candidatus Peregrinibacteria bacterium]
MSDVLGTTEIGKSPDHVKSLELDIQDGTPELKNQIRSAVYRIIDPYYQSDSLPLFPKVIRIPEEQFERVRKAIETVLEQKGISDFIVHKSLGRLIVYEKEEREDPWESLGYKRGHFSSRTHYPRSAVPPSYKTGRKRKK